MGRVCGTHGRYEKYRRQAFYICVTLRPFHVTIVAFEEQ